MTLARRYNALFKRNLQHFAAWSPLVDSYDVGDYGVFRRGVFQRLGSIREFGVDPGARPSATKVSFSYATTGTTVVSGAGAGQPAVASRASGALELAFQGSDALYVRAGELRVMEMPSVDAVAHALLRTHDASGRQWRPAWRIVRKVYTATDPVILASTEERTTFALSGSAQALAMLGGGRGSADITVRSNRANTLQITSGTGPIALDLFRVGLGGRAGLVSLAPGRQGEAEVELDLDDDWDGELDDDLPDNEA